MVEGCTSKPGYLSHADDVGWTPLRLPLKLSNETINARAIHEWDKEFVVHDKIKLKMMFGYSLWI